MVKTKTWVFLIAGFLLVFLAAGAILYTRSASGTVANIYRDGVVVRSVDLSLVTEPYEFTLTDARGSNVVRVEPGRIAVIGAEKVLIDVKGLYPIRELKKHGFAYWRL